MKTTAKKTPIQVLEPASAPAPLTLRLGSIPIASPKEMMQRGQEVAKMLVDILEQQTLYSVINNRRYVLCEGWTTMGAMLGVVPVEDYCRVLPEAKGFEAKVNLIRVSDGTLVGSASAECTRDEKNWSGRDSYSLRSMAITRATGKAFRLSFSWIVKLAGYEPTPAEEMYSAEGSKDAQQKVAKEKIQDFENRVGKKSPDATAAPEAGAGAARNGSPSAAPAPKIPGLVTISAGEKPQTIAVNVALATGAVRDQLHAFLIGDVVRGAWLEVQKVFLCPDTPDVRFAIREKCGELGVEGTTKAGTPLPKGAKK